MSEEGELHPEDQKIHGMTPDEYRELVEKYKDALEYVEGIGPVYGEKLKAIGLMTPLDLLNKGRFRKGREEIAEQSGISHKLILDWVNHIDLYRLNGVDANYAELLVKSGVDSVMELAQRNPSNLHEKMLQVNQEKNLARTTPPIEQVEAWVERAKVLPRVIQY
jgi:predicted flap endonuclease-1-like 5' DNA nuclease